MKISNAILAVSFLWWSSFPVLAQKSPNVADLLLQGFKIVGIIATDNWSDIKGDAVREIYLQKGHQMAVCFVFLKLKINASTMHDINLTVGECKLISKA